MCKTRHDRRHQTLRKSLGSDGHCTEMCVVTTKEKKNKKERKKKEKKG
jgi:hypothetical protein